MTSFLLNFAVHWKEVIYYIARRNGRAFSCRTAIGGGLLHGVSAMSAIESIIKWAQTLPGWQADAVRRLLQQEELTEADRNELFEMLQLEAGIASTSPKAIFPKLGSVSGTGPIHDPIILKKMEAISHVNAIENGSAMLFGHQGITVIYGENGSGKTSYARVLKRACRARDTTEPIHPNIFSSSERGPASATIKIGVGTKTEYLSWTDGKSSDDRLATVTYFDSKCARVIVDDNNEAVYVPYGCFVFDELVNLIKAFRQRLTNEQPSPITPTSQDIAEGTKAHAFLLTLSRTTTKEDIDAMAAWRDSDEQLLSETITRIAQSNAKESLENSARLRVIAKRANDLSSTLRTAEQHICGGGVKQLNGKLNELLAAREARRIAASAALDGEPLEAGKSSEWRLLYQAAREYSVSVAYPGSEFPQTSEEGRCVLCMQEFSEEASARMQRFKDFMDDKSQELLSVAEKAGGGGCLNRAGILGDSLV